MTMVGNIIPQKTVKSSWDIDGKDLEAAGALIRTTSAEDDANISEDLQHAERVRNLEVQESLKYEPLDDARNQTRLVELEENSDRSKPINCKLTTINIGEDTSYKAVSYRWGSTLRRQTIKVNGKEHEVTQNLYDALVELRSKGFLRVWVDALCVDQRDKAEIGRNFHKMCSIYSYAEAVFAWLGKSDYLFEELKSMFDLLSEFREKKNIRTQLCNDEVVLNELLNMWHEQEQGGFSRIEMIKKLIHSSVENSGTLRKKQLDFLRALANVLNKRFWRRAWILEELTVASKVILSCGPYSLDFDILSSCLVGLEKLARNSSFAGFTDNHRHVHNIIALRTKWECSEAISLLTALQKSFGTVALREYDKIYSLFGISQDGKKFIRDVDTDLEFTEIIRRMTETSIKLRKRLGIICLRSRENGRKMGLPSWAPDLPSIGGDRYNDRLVRYLTRQEDEPGHRRRHRWHATGDSKWETVAF